MTISVGGEQFQISRKQQAPLPGQPYRELDDAHLYAAAAHLTSNLLMVVGHVSDQFTIKPTQNIKDSALDMLQERIQAATRGAHRENDMIIKTTQDPELQKKQAEQAEKERMKAQRRRETAAARMDGSGRYNRGGLSIGDLESGRRGPGAAGRKRGAPGSGKQKSRKPEYDSDDDLPSGAYRGEEYDLGDDFIAPSDEEIETDEGDEEEEELLDDDDEDEAPRSKRQKTAEADDADADAEADLEDDEPPAGAEPSRARRRNVLDDDDE
jgi:RNA polymerase-associated protein LEO1